MLSRKNYAANGIDYIADTNALIYLLAGNDCMKPFLDSRLGVSVMSKLEILSYPGISDKEERGIRGLLDDCVIEPLDDEVIARAIELRRVYRLKLPDAVIAATAIVQGSALLTADTDFAKIDELQLEQITPAQ